MARKSSVGRKSTTPTARRMPPAVLRRKWHRSQQERERRDEKQAMHVAIICLTQSRQGKELVPHSRRIRTLPQTRLPEAYRFLVFEGLALGAGFFAFAGCFGAGLAACFAGLLAAFTGVGVAFAVSLPFAGGAAA